MADSMRALHRSLRLVAGLAALLLVALGDASAQTKVVIGTSKDPNLGAQIIVARDKGFFREQNLDAEIKFFPSGGDLIGAFVGGSVQMGSSGSAPLTLLRGRPYPVKVVAQIADIAGAQQLIVPKSINTPQDLYGKKVGLLRGTASEALWNAIVKNYSLDVSKIEVVSMGAAEMLQALVQGSISAASLWEPHCTRAAKAANGKVLVSGTRSNVPGHVGPQRIFGDHALLFANESFIRDNPQVVHAVIAALAKASDFMSSNKAESVAILAKEFQFDDADMEKILGVNVYTLALDQQLVYDLDQTANFMVQLKRLPGPLDPKSWIDPAPLTAARPQLVQLK